MVVWSPLSPTSQLICAFKLVHYLAYKCGFLARMRVSTMHFADVKIFLRHSSLTAFVVRALSRHVAAVSCFCSFMLCPVDAASTVVRRPRGLSKCQTTRCSGRSVCTDGQQQYSFSPRKFGTGSFITAQTNHHIKIVFSGL